MNNVLERLDSTIQIRIKESSKKSHTAKLVKKGPEKCAEKFGEEAIELIDCVDPAFGLERLYDLFGPGLCGQDGDNEYGEFGLDGRSLLRVRARVLSVL